MKGTTTFGSVSIHLASSDLIESLSYGEVKKPETINYRTLRPERDGLFCERIFGPTKDFECTCGKFRSIRYKGIVCDKCGVEVTESKVRRYRTGHINLAAPIAHIWYYRIVPSKIALLLEVPPSDIQSILYFEKYIVIDTGETDLMQNQVLTDEEYDEYRDKYKEAFQADTGAVAIQKILKNMDLDALSDELRELVEHKPKVDKKVLKRLELVEELRKSDNKPEWMILDIIPVIPPDLRPMVPLDGGRFATSDINDLYRRLINRNNRLKKLKQVNAPDIIIKNEMRMVQDAVDSLFDNSRRTHPVTGNGDRPLKSLSDILKGKQGRFRQNLLGKRVDYSGRSVIIVGPSLKLHQCGLPKQMALELFKPFVMRGLVDQGYAHNIKAAKRMIEMEHELVWGILEEVVRDHPVLLNRAPTLHRLGIQAFEPILIEEKAIQLHPLVCHAYNADFDGDQMAVHVPLTPEAQVEAWMLMLSSRNLLNPANGKPIVYPTQDMVLGIYYLTKKTNEENDPKTLRSYDRVEEIIFAVESGVIDYNTAINFKMDGVWRKDTTVGRVLFNQIVPEKLRYIEDTMNSKKLELSISKCYKTYGIKETARYVDELKNVGYTYATRFGVTIAISDVEVPEEKHNIVQETEKAVKRIEENARSGLITHDEKYNQVVDLWAGANERIKRFVESKLKSSYGGFNSLYIMMDSGARGSREQIRQLAGMRGLMAKPSGEIIELAIKSNFKEGLSVLEYFISSHGARKGLADTALKTADAGYLTRKLVDISQDVVIAIRDCGTVKGIDMSAIKQGDEIVKPLRDRIVGRTVVSNIYDPRNGELLIKSNEVLDEDASEAIENAGIETIKIRSVLTCEAKQGVCAKCYGWDLSQRMLANIGEAVGIIAAESIGQPGTQLTMRTFHIGGIAATQMGESEVKLNYDAFVVGSPYFTPKTQKIMGNEEVRQFAKNALPESSYAELEAAQRFSPTFLTKLNPLLDKKDFYKLIPFERLGKAYDLNVAKDIAAQLEGEELAHFNSWLFERTFRDSINSEESGLPDNLIYRLDREGKPELVNPRKSFIRVRKVINSYEMAQLQPIDFKTLEEREFNSEEVVFAMKDGTPVKFGSRVFVVVKPNEGMIHVLDNDIHEYSIKVGATMYVRKGRLSKKGEKLADFDPYNELYLSEYNGIVGYAMEGPQGNETKNKNIIMLRDEERNSLDRIVVMPGTTLAVPEETPVKAGDVLARRPMGRKRARDIVGGLPRVTELFESRKPKSISVISKVSGEVSDIEQKKGKYVVSIRAKNGQIFAHLIPSGKNIYVRIGDKVQAADQLSEGQISSHDILRVQGYTAVEEFLLNEIQGVYRLQGVDINEKHISIIVRQMLKKVEIVDAGDTEFIIGQNVDKIVFNRENESVISQGGQPAKARPILMGLTKASLFTESFFSAASFQETPRVLSTAALRGAIDKLQGLKENLVIGQLIPAGTGIKYYQGIKLRTNE